MGLFSSIGKVVKKVANVAKKVSPIGLGGHMFTMGAANLAPKAFGIKSTGATTLLRGTTATLAAVAAGAGAASRFGTAKLPGSFSSAVTAAVAKQPTPPPVKPMPTMEPMMAAAPQSRKPRRQCRTYRGRRYCRWV